MTAPQLTVIAMAFGATAVVLLIALGFYLLTLKRRLQHLQNEHSHHLKVTEEQLRHFQHQLDEKQNRSLVQSRHLQQLQNSLTAVEAQVKEVKLQDPSMRLYQRAAELVKQGASVEELVQTCDIPHTEAEMIMKIHKDNPPPT
ncbi:DUF2802 domain-containing protein [Salinimonas marina]|uniref:DUF2802 domain-containing protein n=1 Tax=Salinimonas marina TaxID=2785918 RepID=A0A7S9DW38_9ALTE|nr:DUF2802 domain-containing protein [Salinimonas marina]QPG04922.1 DUF2802 domain-containing protein [Salinimonas marina]